MNRILIVLIAAMAASALLGACRPGLDPNGTRTQPLVVILWDPHRPNQGERPLPSQVEGLLFGPAPSLANYYATESNGHFQVEYAAVLGWYDADKPADHYWNHPQSANDGYLSGHVEKWSEAIRKASADFDFKAYDTDGDGVLSSSELSILILIPQASPFGTNRQTAARETPSYKPLVIDGLKFGTIAEVYTGSPINFGVIVHELGHLFHGFPDLYGAGPYGSGSYSIMDVTYTDAQLDPYDKLKQGWLDVLDAGAPGRYSLTSVEKSHTVASITRPGTHESFIIENRQHGIYDTRLPDTGLAIWNLIKDESVPGWVSKNIRLLRRGMLKNGTSDDAQALWHSPEADSVTLRWADGTESGITIRDISTSADTMSFTVELSQIPAPACR